MRKLEAKKDKGRYKSTSHWLDAVYRNNKELIDNKLKDVKTTNKRRVFKNLVLEQSGIRFKGSLTNKELNFQLNKVKNPTKALKKLSRSDVFSSYKERAQENAYKALKEYKAINKIRQLSGEKGKFDPSKLEWNRKENAYRYGDVFVSFVLSPPDDENVIKIEKIAEELLKEYGYV